MQLISSVYSVMLFVFLFFCFKNEEPTKENNSTLSRSIQLTNERPFDSCILLGLMLVIWRQICRPPELGSDRPPKGQKRKEQPLRYSCILLRKALLLVLQVELEPSFLSSLFQIVCFIVTTKNYYITGNAVLFHYY